MNGDKLFPPCPQCFVPMYWVERTFIWHGDPVREFVAQCAEHGDQKVTSPQEAAA